jgi:hypothetical protein
LHNLTYKYRRTDTPKSIKEEEVKIQENLYKLEEIIGQLSMEVFNKKRDIRNLIEQ